MSNAFEQVPGVSKKDLDAPNLSRRRFLKKAGAVSAALIAPEIMAGDVAPEKETRDAHQESSFEIDPQENHALREIFQDRLPEEKIPVIQSDAKKTGSWSENGEAFFNPQLVKGYYEHAVKNSMPRNNDVWGEPSADFFVDGERVAAAGWQIADSLTKETSYDDYEKKSFEHAEYDKFHPQQFIARAAGIVDDPRRIVVEIARLIENETRRPEKQKTYSYTTAFAREQIESLHSEGLFSFILNEMQEAIRRDINEFEGEDIMTLYFYHSRRLAELISEDRMERIRSAYREEARKILDHAR